MKVRQISPSCSPALCTVDEDPRRGERDRSLLEMEKHPGSWRWCCPRCYIPQTWGGAPKLPTVPTPTWGWRWQMCQSLHCSKAELRCFFPLFKVEHKTQKASPSSLFKPSSFHTRPLLVRIQNPPTDRHWQASRAALLHLQGSPHSPASCTVPFWKEINPLCST